MRRYRNEPVYTGAIGIGRLLFGTLRVKLRVAGRENLPIDGGAVIAVTHFGYLEFAIVEWVTWLANRRRIRFMAKKGAFKGWPLGALMRNMKHIPVDRAAGSHAYDEAVTALRDGELVGVFPEGTVSRSFEVQLLKAGAVRLAQAAGVPLIPVAVWGAHRILTKGAKSKVRDRVGVPVYVKIGTPVEVGAGADIHDASDALRLTLQQLADELQDIYPIDGTGQWWQPVRRGGTAPSVADVEHEQRGSRRTEDSAD
ncbi:lysophospholipid acyltransferase family protein [Pseudolysinimonas sp.]|uniref:lysophospholipid acyltransferase family protein n=1 Tax=Pseudolysinimonas sp. TaxID=2680009 RepID=UPI00286A5FA0|nr:lysophospholipid acyltransferase family protein [Pseudolysinimonas sp.]